MYIIHRPIYINLSDDEKKLFKLILKMHYYEANSYQDESLRLIYNSMLIGGNKNERDDRKSGR